MNQISLFIMHPNHELLSLHPGHSKNYYWILNQKKKKTHSKITQNQFLAENHRKRQFWLNVNNLILFLKGVISFNSWEQPVIFFFNNPKHFSWTLCLEWKKIRGHICNENFLIRLLSFSLSPPTNLQKIHED